MTAQVFSSNNILFSKSSNHNKGETHKRIDNFLRQLGKSWRKHKGKKNWRQRNCLRWMSLNSDHMHNCTLQQRGRKIIISIFTAILWVPITCQTLYCFLYFISFNHHLWQTILKTILCNMYATSILFIMKQKLWEIK